MAIINKTGITNGATIEAEHITRAIDALSGVSTDTIIATGSFSGSLVGIATSASYAVTASYATIAGNGVTIDNNSNNYIVTATGNICKRWK
jgi:predicted TIM-barrel enzyme